MSFSAMIAGLSLRVSWLRECSQVSLCGSLRERNWLVLEADNHILWKVASGDCSLTAGNRDIFGLMPDPETDKQAVEETADLK